MFETSFDLARAEDLPCRSDSRNPGGRSCTSIAPLVTSLDGIASCEITDTRPQDVDGRITTDIDFGRGQSLYRVVKLASRRDRFDAAARPLEIYVYSPRIEGVQCAPGNKVARWRCIRGPNARKITDDLKSSVMKAAVKNQVIVRSDLRAVRHQAATPSHATS